MEQQIIDFLNDQPCIRSTAYIAKHCVYKDQYQLNVYPDKSSVQGAYYRLKKLSDAGKIKYVPRGMWRSIKDIS